uniref:Uncharacterized protein n=1 Tax=Varanus komodoensis TaxID=61221 RepID=A0A8D2L7P7_VARKO
MSPASSEKSRQQVINEVNKRRTLLQDNSWIKKRPEDEKVGHLWPFRCLGLEISPDGNRGPGNVSACMLPILAPDKQVLINCHRKVLYSAATGEPFCFQDSCQSLFQLPQLQGSKRRGLGSTIQRRVCGLGCDLNKALREKHCTSKGNIKVSQKRFKSNMGRSRDGMLKVALVKAFRASSLARHVNFTGLLFRWQF